MFFAALAAVFFCSQTGVRIAGPGVSKDVDPENGHDEVVEEPPAAAPEMTADERTRANRELEQLEADRKAFAEERKLARKKGDKPADATKSDDVQQPGTPATGAAPEFAVGPQGEGPEAGKPIDPAAGATGAQQ